VIRVPPFRIDLLWAKKLIPSQVIEAVLKWLDHLRDTVNGRILTAKATLDFDATDPKDLTVTVTGAEIGDGVVVTPPAFTAAADYSALVSSANTVTIRKVGAGDPASGIFTVAVIKILQ
jgi:hypothetical protein